MAKIRMPAEWEPHRATWIAWPHEETDWPIKFACIEWVYAEIVRLLAGGERVEILCTSQEQAVRAERCLSLHRAPTQYRLHICPNDRGWLRDTAPTCVLTDGKPNWVGWKFNAWAKYDNYLLDSRVAPFVAKVSGHPLTVALRPDNSMPLVLEGGAIETDGQGTLLVTEECLLSEVQCRNPGLSRTQYEQAFKQYLGIEQTIWLAGSCAGDDTHGHIDDVARFVAPQTVVVAYQQDPRHEDHAVSKENLARLQTSKDAHGRSLQIVPLPVPAQQHFGEEVLPASYANFYMANGLILVPTFNDPADRIALGILADLCPRHRVVGVHAVDLVLGFGTLHCLSQQEPLAQA